MLFTIDALLKTTFDLV